MGHQSYFSQIALIKILTQKDTCKRQNVLICSYITDFFFFKCESFVGEILHWPKLIALKFFFWIILKNK
jgi:hypothetical protein